MEQPIYSSISLERRYKEYILFLHVFPGYDGISAIYYFPDMILLQKPADLQDVLKIFNQRNESHALIAENDI